jgi:hypothetical protein
VRSELTQSLYDGMKQVIIRAEPELYSSILDIKSVIFRIGSVIVR